MSKFFFIKNEYVGIVLILLLKVIWDYNLIAFSGKFSLAVSISSHRLDPIAVPFP